LEDLSVVGRLVFEWEHVDWIDLAQDRDKWRDFVKTVMNLPVT
jgi:hypothetical protein